MRGDRGSSLHEAGEGGEELADFTGMLEAVTIVFSVAFVAHHLGETKRAQYIAHARDASADWAGDLAGSQQAVEKGPSASLRSIASLQRIGKYASARRFLARLASGPF